MWVDEQGVIFFDGVEDFEVWMEANHASVPNVTIGFWKAATKREGLTYQQSVDVALCFGWIDGIVRRRDDETYTHRFTPRRKTTVWSPTNIKRAEELIQEGRMRDAGRKAFEARDPGRTDALYGSLRSGSFTPEMLAQFRDDAQAWQFYESQPASYRSWARYWVISAKREETRVRRLQRLMEVSRNRQRLDALAPNRDS